MTCLFYATHAADETDSSEPGYRVYALAMWLIAAPSKEAAENTAWALIRNLYWQGYDEDGEEKVSIVPHNSVMIRGQHFRDVMEAWYEDGEEYDEIPYDGYFMFPKGEKAPDDQVFEAEEDDYPWIKDLVKQMVLTKLSS